MAQYLGLDVGTQGVKALVYDAGERRVVGRGAHTVEMLPVDRPGAAEQEPQDWIRALEAALQIALDDEGVRRGEVAALGVSGQQHGFVALDEHGKVIRPAKLWCDTETAPEAAALSEELGRPLPAGFTASKILWLKRHEPESFARLRTVLLPHDYANLHLTGRAAMECGDASGTGFFDPERRAFDARAMAAVDPGLEAMLPPLIGPTEWVGTLRTELAARFELPEELRVAPGSGDNMMSALGAGAVRNGVMVASLGTSGTLFARSPRPVVDGSGMVAPFCDATGAWLPLLCTMNCTTVTEEVVAAFGLDHDALARAAEPTGPGAGGLTFLPYLAGERAPDWPHARGAVHGLTPGGLRPGPLYRAAVEGATFALKQGAEHLARHGVTAQELRVVGGGSKSRLWRRVLADVFGLPLRFPREPESAALGGALQAMALDAGAEDVAAAVDEHGVALEEETVDPDPATAAAYAAAYERFRELGETLFGGGRGALSAGSAPRPG